MSFTVVECAQRSDEWRQVRSGRATGSRACDVVDFLKSGGESARRRDYRLQLVCERLTGRPQESGYQNDEMRRGIEMEATALATYEVLTKHVGQETGFLMHNELPAGCSLDAHVGDFEVLVSLKAPKSATHLRYLRSGQMPVEHVPQMLHEMFVVEQARAYDFLSFDDRFPASMQVFYVRVLREDIAGALAEYAQQLTKFLAEVEHELESLRTMASTKQALIDSLAVAS